MGLTNPSPRAAAALFGRALARLDQIQPTALREPIRNMLRAGIELCTISPSLLGRPINHLVDLALVLTTEPEQGPHP